MTYAFAGMDTVYARGGIFCRRSLRFAIISGIRCVSRSTGEGDFTLRVTFVVTIEPTPTGRPPQSPPELPDGAAPPFCSPNLSRSDACSRRPDPDSGGLVFTQRECDDSSWRAGARPPHCGPMPSALAAERGLTAAEFAASSRREQQTSWKRPWTAENDRRERPQARGPGVRQAFWTTCQTVHSGRRERRRGGPRRRDAAPPLRRRRGPSIDCRSARFSGAGRPRTHGAFTGAQSRCHKLAVGTPVWGGPFVPARWRVLPTFR